MAKPTARRTRRATKGGNNHQLVDGVPVFWADRPGELQAALVVRAGVVDEAVTERGLTHLVEHLTLSRVDDGLVHGWNGFVDMTRTVFFASGEPDEIAAFLERVCATLSDLPLERFKLEQSVLRAEAASYSAGIHGDLLTARYGLRGPGVVVLRELGLESATEDVAARWAERFSADNAALWLSGPPPDGLQLPLPRGERRPLPPLPDPVAQCPAYTVGRPDAAAMGIVVAPDAPIHLALAILERRLLRRLRAGEGVSYAVTWNVQQISKDEGHVVVSVDAAGGRGPEAWTGLREEVERLASTRPARDEVEHAVNRARRQMAADDGVLAHLDRTAIRELTGRPHRSMADQLEELESCTPAKIRSQFAAAVTTAIFQVPADAPRPDDLTMVPTSSTATVEGRRFLPSRPGSEGAMVVGADGITIETPAARATVLVTESVGVLRWADGNRAALGGDGFVVNVDPSRWSSPSDVLDAFDRTFEAVPFVVAGRRRRAPEPRPFRPRRLSRLGFFGSGLALVFGSALFALLGGIPGLVVFVVAFLAVALRVTARRVRDPDDWGVQVWDDTSATDWSRWPPDLPTSQVYVACGLLLGWFVTRDLVSDWFRSESGPDLDDFLAGRITGPQLYQRWDGILTTDMLSDDGRAFARHYLGDTHRPARGFDRDYAKLWAGLPSAYHVPDTPESAAALATIADRRLANWRRWRVIYECSEVDSVGSSGKQSR